MNVVEHIRGETPSFADRVAIVEGSKSITYGGLLARVDELKIDLLALGIGPGQRIGFYCKDGIDYVVGALALLDCGAAVVPVADSLTDREIAETIVRIDVHGMLVHAAMLPRLMNVQTAYRDTGFQPLPANSHGLEARVTNEIFTWKPRAFAGESDDRCREMEAAFIRFSSGTTGESKGVVLSHQSIIERTDAANQGLGISHEDVILWVLGMSHHFVVSILLFLRKGATIIVANQFFPFSVLDAARRYPITFIYASPVHYHLLSQSSAVKPDALSKVRLAISTSMKMPPDISAAFAAKFGFAPAEAYGIIEIGLPFINTEPRGAGRGTVGHVLPAYQFQIIHADATGIGEVHIKGKGMFDAYFSPWRTRAECTDAGWFHTGDLGRADESGRLCLLGRSKTVLVCAGMKVFPEEVEAIINTMPGVRESLVMGRDHPQYGQVPVARVVIVDGSENVLDELRGYCMERLSSYMVPVEFTRVESLPKTASGKVARRPARDGK